MGSSSGPSASSSSSSYQGSQGTVQSNGPANLGAMSSLDPSCTPLKHRYDSCFNSWFQDYLAVPLVSGSSSSSSSNASASKSSDKKCTFFDELGSESYGSKSRADNDSLKRLRAAKREELESKCGPIFAEYQACVKNALREKYLLPLISQAREYNPFPFPGTGSTASRPSAFPFPFAAATEQERKDSESREGW